MGGAISLNIYFQSQICVYVSALMVSSFGLMCSSVAEKTSKATGMVVIGGILVYYLVTAAALSGAGIFVCSSPFTFLVWLQNQTGGSNRMRWSHADFYLFGAAIPMLIGYLLINVPLIFLWFTIAVRRITNEEFSFISFRQAAIVFVILEFILCGILINHPAGAASVYEVRAFHGINALMLLLFAFGLAPTGELVRSRLHRSRPNEHWKIFFERTNRFHDAPGVAATLLFCAGYAVVALFATSPLSSTRSEDMGVIILVSCMGAAMAAVLLYIQVYSEGSGYKLAFVLLLAGLIVPPVFMAIGQWWDRTLYVSPFLYVILLHDFASLTVHRPSLQGPGPMGEVWSCPAICVALAILGCMLAAMRIRYLLDLNEAAKAHEREAQRKAEAALPAGMIVARMQAQTVVSQSAMQPSTNEK
jgi:hypothetical protein